MGKDNKFRETRIELIKKSQLAKKIREEKGLSKTVNEILLNYIYNTEGAEEFNTFAQWKQKGYTIFKGAKAFTVWGQPRQGREKEEEQPTAPPDNNVEDEYSFFPVCYLFSDKQVIKPEAKPGSKIVVDNPVSVINLDDVI